MKRIFRIIIFLLSIQLADSQNTVTVYGKITNPKGNQVSLRFYKDYISYEEVIASTAQLDNQGNFKMTFNWDSPYPAQLVHGSEITRMYISPKDNIQIIMDANNLNETVKYEGKGSFINNYIAQKTRTIPVISSDSYKMEEIPFTHFVDSIHNKAITFFHDYFSKHNDTSRSYQTFLETEGADIKYNWVNTKKNYPGSYSYFNQLKNTISLPASYYDFLKQASIKDNKAIHSIEYLQFLERYVNEEVINIKKQDSTLNNIDLIEQFINQHFSDEMKEYLYAKWAYFIIAKMNDLGNGKLILEKYKNNTQQKYSEVLDKAFAFASRLLPGQPAPQFTLPDTSGKLISLKDFIGKVVYLDFWASWCGPCRMEIPHAAKLEEDLKDKDIVFLKVSIDTNEDAWKKIIRESKLKGTHLISKGENNNIGSLYNVKGIPLYVIIDKDGKIVDSYAKRPSGDVKKDLEALLK